MQMAAVAITLGMSIVGGILTGLLLRIPIFSRSKSEDFFDDNNNWLVKISLMMYYKYDSSLYINTILLFRVGVMLHREVASL